MQTNQVGGRLIGEGVYGCIFDPAPRCAGGSVFKRIGKMRTVGKITSEYADDELGIGKAIMHLPLATQYFALPSIGCKAPPVIDDPEVEDCKLLKKEKSDLTLLIMPAAGETIHAWSKNRARLAEKFVFMMKHLLEGMVIYQRAGYIHNDIHYKNILVDEFDVPRYIDFGLGFKLDRVNRWEDANIGYSFKPAYIFMPPELHIWRGIKNGVSVRDAVRELKDIHREYGQIEKAWGSADDILYEFSQMSKCFRERDGVTFIRTYARAFDVWRIGMFFWMMWNDLLFWTPFKESALYAERDRVVPIMKGLVHFSPARRYTAEKALLELDPRNRLVS